MRVALLALSLLLQVSSRTGVIEGFVMRAGTQPPSPLVNARLELTGGPDELLARTDATGRFVFSGLPPGRFRLYVTKDGFIRQEYPHAAMGSPGLPINLLGGQEIRNLVFALEPARTISGTIRDSRNAPIAGLVVQALKRGFDRRGNRALSLAASTRTDDKGYYRIYWLDPGEYFLCALPPRPPGNEQRTVALAPTYFPGSPALDDARPVRLDSDRDANGLDFALRTQILGWVRGTALSITTGRPAEGIISLVPPEDGAGIARFQTKSSSNPQLGDNFAFTNVPPGSYILSGTSGTERAARRIVVRDPDLRANLDLEVGVTVRGRIFEAPVAADLRTTRIGIAEVDTALPQPQETAALPDGSFTLTGIQPGYYSVHLTGLPEDLYLKAALFAGADALQSPFAIASTRGGDPVELAIQVGVDGGRLSGGVVDANDKVFVGALVTLVPAESRSRLDLYRTVVSQEDGSFTFRGIAPGDYKLFAWVNPEANAYLNVEYMRYYENAGTPVRIVPGQNRPLSLRAITIER